MVVRDCSDVHKRNLRVDVLGDTRGQQLVVDSIANIDDGSFTSAPASPSRANTEGYLI